MYCSTQSEPPSLDGGWVVSTNPQPFYPPGRIPGTRSARSWVGPRVFFFFFFYQGPGHMPQMHRSLIDLLCHPSNVQTVPTFATSPPSRPCYPRDPWQRRTELLRGRETWPTILPKMPDFHVTFRDLLHAVRHGTDSFTSPPKEGFFSP